MNDVILLGDSVFDNARYVAKGMSVAEVLRTKYKQRVLLCAQDGAVAEDVPLQVVNCESYLHPHFFMSVGGNNALQSIVMLNWEVQTIGEALAYFAARIHSFELAYTNAILTVLPRQLTVCTIYEGPVRNDPVKRIGLSMFNDMIVKSANELGVNLLDLRTVCTKRSHFNGIEPSTIGSQLIAKEIYEQVSKN